MFNIDFYRTENEKCPIVDFLDSLPNKLGAKAIRDLDVLSEKGNALREPYSKPIEGGIFELRISASRDEARIFYFFLIESKIILTNGFIKKTQKTPRKEIIEPWNIKRTMSGGA